MGDNRSKIKYDMKRIIPYICLFCKNDLKEEHDRLVCVNCGNYWDVI